MAYNNYASAGIDSIAILDFETTGLDPRKDFPTEVAVKKFYVDPYGLPISFQFYSSMIRLPKGVKVPPFITELTGLTDEKVYKEGKERDQVEKKLDALIDERTMVVAHNANFDLGFLYFNFGIIPNHFYCTRTAEILNYPSHNASLSKVFPRRFPDRAEEQQHRAMGDVEMTYDVLLSQQNEFGVAGILGLKNKVVNMPDRELSFAPYNSIILDFTNKYVAKHTYEKTVKQLGEMATRLEELEEYIEANKDKLDKHNDTMVDVLNSHYQ